MNLPWRLPLLWMWNYASSLVHTSFSGKFLKEFKREIITTWDIFPQICSWYRNQFWREVLGRRGSRFWGWGEKGGNRKVFTQVGKGLTTAGGWKPQLGKFSQEIWPRFWQSNQGKTCKSWASLVTSTRKRMLHF